jgi:ParB-like chromosome segregation protein Spo0J
MHEIRNVSIKDLVLLKDNPRKITKDELNRLCDSLISDPGFLDSRPILINEVDGILNVYAGNQRVQAAKKLKWKEIPCIVEKDLSLDLMKSRVLKDNKHAGEFDYDLLASIYDIDELISVGFTPEELHLNLEHDELDSKDDEEKEKKLKCCPSCGHEF